MPVPFPPANCPGRQKRHTLASLLPGMGLAVPGAHSMHDALLDAPRVGLYDPARHGVNVCRTLAAPSAEQKPPSGQSSHVAALSPSLYLPAGHAMQLSADRASLGLCVPGVQGRQLELLVPTVGGGSK